MNARDDLLRKRFTIAHELGHIMLNFSEEDERKTREKLCHAFAGAFLLPKKVMKIELGERRKQIALWELKKLKGIYGLSIRKIMARANRLEIITDYMYRNFRISANKQVWNGAEPGEYLGKEHPNRFDQLVYHAAAEDMITFSKAADLLNISLSELRRRLQIVS